jgi:hypothetical protein
MCTAQFMRDFLVEKINSAHVAHLQGVKITTNWKIGTS